jgi:hypothetical protein
MTPVVFDGFAETKKNLENKLAPYKSLIISDVKNVKKTRASLHKLAKQVNDRKKELKRPYVDATKPMEDQAKELIALIDTVVKPINDQIKAIESEERQQRIDRLKALIADMAFSYHIDPYQVDIKPKWANKSIGDLELKRQIAEELSLMVKYGKGVLPDGINRVNGGLVSDDGEMVQKRLLTLYVTNEQLMTILSDLNVAEIPYEQVGGTN